MTRALYANVGKGAAHYVLGGGEMKIQVKYVDFDGPCPFLMCLEREPHRHAVCPSCGAIRFGNMFCDLCRAVYEHTRLWIKAVKRTEDAEEAEHLTEGIK